MRRHTGNYTNKEKGGFYLTIGFITLYALFMLYCCIRIDALVPDETWFYDYAVSLKDQSFFELLNTPNYLGYGCIYWSTLALLKDLTAIRLFCWGCLLAIPICVLIVLRKAFNRTWMNILIATVLLLSCPFTWFTGKIIGPELYGNAMGAIGATVILSQKEKKKHSWAYFFGGLIIGISTGIKMYNLIFGLFVGLYEIWPDITEKGLSIKRRIVSVISKGFSMLLGCILGFVVANPFILRDFETFSSNVHSLHSSFSLGTIWNLLTCKAITWDLVNSGGYVVALFH